MAKHGKRYRDAASKVDPSATYSIGDAVKLVQSMASAKFDETVEVHVRLGIDSRKSDQTVRGTVALPHGTGRNVRVAAIAQGEAVQAAEAAGADIAGSDDLVERIAGGFFEFDAVAATPDMMAAIGAKLGRVLGPKGLLPNPKSGTVGPDIAAIVTALKAGRIEFRADKTGVVHAPIGKASFDPSALVENFEALNDAVNGAKPEAAKGQYIRSVFVASTMGPSVRVAI